MSLEGGLFFWGPDPGLKAQLYASLPLQGEKRGPVTRGQNVAHKPKTTSLDSSSEIWTVFHS